MDRTETMKSLGIDEVMISTIPVLVTEKMFCAALLNEGTVVTARVLKKYNEIRDVIINHK
jgi:hypothetical protein